MNIIDINYIIYNNRSQKLVEKFLPKVEIQKFLELENKYNFILSTYKDIYQHNVLIDSNYLNKDYKDIIISKEELEELDIKLKKNKINHNHIEYSYLTKRNIPIKYIETFSCLSYDWTQRELEVMGASLHPLLENTFNNQINNGIIIPIYENSKLVNIIVRRLENGPIKYSLAIPDLPIINYDTINENDELWICEGYFDNLALQEQGLKAINVSSSAWSTIQLYLLINKKPSFVNIFADYDYTGLRNASIIKRLLNMYNINVKIWCSKYCKDASEHFFEKNFSINDIEEVGVNKILLELLEPDENDNYYHYLKYKKN